MESIGIDFDPLFTGQELLHEAFLLGLESLQVFFLFFHLHLPLRQPLNNGQLFLNSRWYPGVQFQEALKIECHLLDVDSITGYIGLVIKKWGCSQGGKESYI